MSQETENTEKKAHFSNENIQVDVVFHPHCKVELHIQIQPIAVEAARQAAFKSLKKEVSVPGFRRGKAPDAFIHKHYAQAWEKETQEKAVQLAIREAVQLSGVYPITQFRGPRIHAWTQEKGFSISTECEVRPEVPEVDIATLGLKEVPPAPVSERHVELLLHKTLLPLASLQPITDRGAEEGDIGKFDILWNGNSPKQIVKEKLMEIEEEEFPDWMREQIRGMRPGETRRVEPSEVHQEKGAFLDVHLIELFSAYWPDLTQEDVLQQLKVESEADLLARLRKRLENDAVLRADVAMSHQMAEVLLTKYSFDLPTAIVYPRWEEHLRLYSEKNKEEGSTDKPEVRRYLLQKAVEEIQLEILVGLIGKKHGIEATQNDIQEELLLQLQLLPMGENQVELWKLGQAKDQLKEAAFTRKVREFLFSQTPKENQLLSVDSQEG